MATSAALRWQLPDHGTVALAYARTDTPESMAKRGLHHSLTSDEWIGGFGKRIGEHASAGFTLRLTSGEIVDESRAAALANQPIRTTTHFLSPDVAFGVAGALSPTIAAGVAAAYGAPRTDNRVETLNALSVPISPPGTFVTLPSHTKLNQFDDSIRTYTIRAGIGIRTTADTGIYLDANGLRISTERSGSQDLGRFAIGFEHTAMGAWTIREGIGVDTTGQANLSFGIGYRSADGIDAEFAFQQNAAPEVNRELGHTRVFAVSIAVRL